MVARLSSKSDFPEGDTLSDRKEEWRAFISRSHTACTCVISVGHPGDSSSGVELESTTPAVAVLKAQEEGQ